MSILLYLIFSYFIFIVIDTVGYLYLVNKRYATIPSALFWFWLIVPGANVFLFFQMINTFRVIKAFKIKGLE